MPETQSNESSNVEQFPGSGEGEEKMSMLKEPNPEFMDALRDAADDLDGIVATRQELNDKAKAIFSSLASKYSVNKDAMKAAMKYVELQDEKKENYDLTYQVMREALGDPVQKDLFTEKLKAEVADHQAKH